MSEMEEFLAAVADEAVAAPPVAADAAAEKENAQRVAGNMLAFVERLDDELFKSLQHIDPHTSECPKGLIDAPLRRC